MSLNVYLAHTGGSLIADTNSFSTVDDLKSWIGRKSSVGSPQQILMTAQGKPVKLQNLFTEREIFVYDRNLIVAGGKPSSGDAIRAQIPEAYHPEEPPDRNANDNSVQAWQALYGERNLWALRLLRRCEDMIKHARRLHEETNVIRRATTVAIEPIKQHIRSLQQKRSDANKWADETLHDQKSLLESWVTSYEKLSALPAQGSLVQFFDASLGAATRSPPQSKTTTLQALVDIEQLRGAASRVDGAIRTLNERVAELTILCDSATGKGRDLADRISKESRLTLENIYGDLDALAEEVSVDVQKVSRDNENALKRQSTTKDIAWLSRTSQLHTQELLPAIKAIADEISNFLRELAERKNHVAQSAINYIQEISAIQSKLALIQPILAGLDFDTEDGAAVDMLDFVARIPAVYGSLLVECVRRHEWIDKMTSDSSSLAEELATYRDEEEKRRKRWFRAVGDYLNSNVLDEAVLGVEVNVKTVKQTWPRFTRAEIDDYLTALENVDGLGTVLEEIVEMKRALDAPSKQQSRRTNAFKNGSMHKLASGKNSLLLRGDNELILSLQADKVRLEDRLKGADSRVRKLEDLLHRQSQVQSRPISRAEGAPSSLEGHAPSPVLTNRNPASPKIHEKATRTPSSLSRRESISYPGEEKVLALRVTQLEADLVAERAKWAQMKDSVAQSAKHEEALKAQVQDAESIKKDLMANFEAQQHEFDGERRILQDDNRVLKDRVDALEEEIDRMAGSQDNARLGLDERTCELDAEIARVREDAENDVQKAQGQVDFLKGDNALHREKILNLERQLTKYGDEKADLEARVVKLGATIQGHERAQLDHVNALRTTHLRLSTEEVPSDFSSLIKAIERISDTAASRLSDTKHALDAARVDKLMHEERINDQMMEITKLKDLLNNEEIEIIALREEVADIKARYGSLESELEDERKDLESLRAKYAAGETGSQALRERLSGEERKTQDLGTQLAAAKASGTQKDATICELSGRLEVAHVAGSDASERLSRLARQAEEVSNKLFLRTDRLTHLLEHIGFTVTRQHGGRLAIQRTARTSSTNGTTIDQSQVMSKSVSNTLPTKADTVPPPYLCWSFSANMEEEQTMYQDFVEDIESFSMDSFSETIIKRIKDIEHVARKWQREAKSYREKFHRAQFDAQNKIAFRSFKEGDLALFLPTRNQAARRSWAAFNVGAPHYFLREQEYHMLNTRDWLLARISKVEDRMVDLSKGLGSETADGLSERPGSESEDGSAPEEDNPFGLSDGLRWYYLDAAEEKLGAPSTPGLAKTTVASAHVDAAGSIERKRASLHGAAAKNLTKSLDSRRSSTNSKKSLVGASVSPINVTAGADPLASATKAGERSPLKASRSRDSIPEEVRKDLLFGP